MGIDIAAAKKEKERKIAQEKKKQARDKKIQAGIEGFKKGYRGTSHICTMCGRPGRPKRFISGNILLEIFLWCLFLLPGLIYSIWRHMSTFYGCPDCGTPTMVRSDSPVGKKLMAES